MKIIFKILLIFCLTKSYFALAQDVDVEFIWAEDDHTGSQIYISQHQNGAWQSPEKIVDDDNLNILPAIGSNKRGQRLAVWSMVDGNDSVLKFSIKRGGSWTKPAVLKSSMATNLAPTVVFDDNDIAWVFWSANNGDNDDIYMSKLIRGRWSEPEMVNQQNDTPDILPEAGLDEDGNIWVTWQQLQDDAYVDMTRSYERTSQRRMSVSKGLKTQDVKLMKLRSNFNDAIDPPEFFKARSRATMHFPNKKRASKPVKGNIN